MKCCLAQRNYNVYQNAEENEYVNKPCGAVTIFASYSIKDYFGKAPLLMITLKKSIKICYSVFFHKIMVCEATFKILCYLMLFEHADIPVYIYIYNDIDETTVLNLLYQ